MAITLARVDDRVIHGQTTTRWTAKKPVDSIIVVSDEVATNELRKKVLKAAAGIYKLGIYNLEQGKAAVPKAVASPKNFFVISDCIRHFAELAEAGVDFGKVLNIGNLNGSREGTRSMGRALMLNDEDAEALDKLVEAGIDVQFQLLPDDEIKSWQQLRPKYFASK